MHIHVQHHTNLLVATIEGRFDAHGIDRFNPEVVDQVGATHPNVIVDLSQVDFMDSSALAGLVKTLKRTMEHGGSIVLAGVTDAARIILELTRLDEVFAQAPSVEDARRLLVAA
jgi:anti-sigma B factor antagonist